MSRYSRITDIRITDIRYKYRPLVPGLTDVNQVLKAFCREKFGAEAIDQKWPTIVSLLVDPGSYHEFRLFCEGNHLEG